MTSGRHAATIPLGRVGGTALRLDPLLPAILALVALLAARRGDLAATMLLLGVALPSVLLHELAHAWAARRRGLRVTAVVLHVVPVTWVESGTPADEWRIALAGPAANLLLGAGAGAAWLAAGGAVPMPLERVLADPGALVAGTNLLLGGLNLLPVLPADGGRALRAWLEARGRPRAGRLATRAAGALAAAALAATAVLVATLPESLYAAALAVLVLAAAFAPRA